MRPCISRTRASYPRSVAIHSCTCVISAGNSGGMLFSELTSGTTAISVVFGL